MLYLNGAALGCGKFPNRETYVDTRRIPLMDGSVIRMQFEDNDDLMNLMLLKGHLDDNGVKDVTLEMPYMPYSTMDHTDGGKPLSLKYVARLINSMKFNHVVTYEPHSMVTEALVDRLEVRSCLRELVYMAMERFADYSTAIFCFPDLGAEKRYQGLGFVTGKTLTFQKVREFNTGKILSMACRDEIRPLDGTELFIILDDLCRGGRTFIECANILRAKGAKQIALCVTHLEQAAFNGVLKKDSPVDLVVATNSCLPQKNVDAEKLVILEI